MVFLFLSGKCFKCAKQLQQVGLLHHAHVAQCLLNCDQRVTLPEQQGLSLFALCCGEGHEEGSQTSSLHSSLPGRSMSLVLLPLQLHPGSALVQSLVGT